MGERDGLIPSELYDGFLTDMMAKTANQTRQLLRTLINAELPTARRKTLCFLCLYWNQVAQQSATNEMNAKDVGVCVSHTILITPKVSDPMEPQRQVALANTAVTV
jgi:hypothetical protein